MTKLMANGMADLFEYFCELDNSVHVGQDNKTLRYLMIFAKHYRDTTILYSHNPCNTDVTWSIAQHIINT